MLFTGLLAWARRGLAGILYEFIFNPYRNSQRRKGSIPDGGEEAAAFQLYFSNPYVNLYTHFLVPSDASSIHSDEDNYDDVKSTVANYQSARSQHYDQYRPAISPGGPSNPISPGKFCPSRRREKNGLIVEMFSSLQAVVSLVTTGGTSSGWNEPNRFTAVQSRFTTALNHQVRPVGRAISTVLSPCTPNPLPDRLPSRPTFTRRAELRCSRHRALIWLEMSTSSAPKAFTPLVRRRPSTESKAFTPLDIRAT